MTDAAEKEIEAAVLVSEHKLSGQQFTLTEVDLRDRSDGHDELVHITEHELSCDQTVSLRGNLFVLQDSDSRQGLILVRRSPLTASRPAPTDKDIEFEQDGDGVTVKLYRADSERAQDLWAALPFEGGLLERTKALQNWQRSLRPDTPLHRIPKFITNTWGDRSRDARITESFILKEFDAAREIGADAVRIDDGWQAGLSGNSAFKGDVQTKGLSGFWGVSNEFWNVHPERFPNGFAPILEKVEETGVRLGLWYAPDSQNEMANWEKDVEALLELYKTHGVCYFKIDGLHVDTPVAYDRVQKLLDTVVERSNGDILLMLDCTGGGSRPGYLGAVPHGNLFVENRYTDSARYWPHRTLRNLWRLGHWIDPARLRFEFLNNERNRDHKKYVGHPHAPGNYPPDYLFATVMMCNPLGWFEASNLSAEYRYSITPLVNVWREHREAIFTSTIVPIGEKPSGESWPGFAAISEDQKSAYMLCFREFTEAASSTYQLPLAFDTEQSVSALYGKGTAELNGAELTVSIPDGPGFVFMRVES